MKTAKKTYTFLIIPLIILMMSLKPTHADTQKIADTIASMSLDEKLGQLILLGFRGMSLDNGKSPEIKNAIQNYHIGSVILFDYDVTERRYLRNIASPSQVRKLNHDLQKLSKIPLFISIDEEGGQVTRLKSRYGFETKPSAKTLGTLSTSKVTESANSLGAELKSVGINLNFAPLADVNVNALNPVIGKLNRSFSDNPYKVSEYCEAFIKGMGQQNVISVLKHFPGHGSSRSDSHLGMVDVSDTWSESELIPFRELIKNNKAQMIMSAHIFNRHLDAEYPATLSKKVLTDLLRNEMGYDGVIISDDMDMGAIKLHYGTRDAIELALNAGVDILLFGNNLNYDPAIALRVHGILKQLYRTGKLSDERLNQSLTRILRLKYSL